MTTSPSRRPVIAIHGGAGTMSRSRISAGQNAAYHAALLGILRAARTKPACPCWR